MQSNTTCESLAYHNLDRTTRAYVVCALWSTNDESTPEGGVPFDENYDCDDIAPDSLARMNDDCQRFKAAVRADVEFVSKAEEAMKDANFTVAEWLDDEEIGHDFWLARCGHGCGFWDGDYEWLYDGAGDRLTELCEQFPARSLYLGDADADGTRQIHEASA